MSIAFGRKRGRRIIDARREDHIIQARGYTSSSRTPVRARVPVGLCAANTTNPSERRSVCRRGSTKQKSECSRANTPVPQYRSNPTDWAIHSELLHDSNSISQASCSCHIPGTTDPNTFVAYSRVTAPPHADTGENLVARCSPCRP